MNVVSLYRGLSFDIKLHVIRMITLVQVLVFHLVRLLVLDSSALFYVDTWVGLSWLLLFVMILIEFAYEVKISKE